VIEQEVKLSFDSAEAARRAVTTAGGRLVVSRRLIDDRLYDTTEGRLRVGSCTLRLRRDGTASILTFKGPLQPGPVKAREQIETTIGDAGVADALLAALGFQPGLRAQKYREEYALDDTRIAIDETPIGVFVEVEGTPTAIARVAGRMGRTSRDYRLESYVELYTRACRARGIPPGDMTF
jgi:adenylate cyclase, class 2